MEKIDELKALLAEGVNVNNYDLLFPFKSQIEDKEIVSELKKAIDDFNTGAGYLSYDPQCDTTACHGWSHVNAATDRLDRLAAKLA